MNKEVEILAPAGSIESFWGAMNAGADAVYVGGNRFSARANATNFSSEELILVIRQAHILCRKVYLTVNTLFKPSEMGELYNYISPLYLEGLHGVIVQDIGVLSFIRSHFPKLSIHASTQMTITSTPGAQLMKELGVTRIVPARELSLAEIIHIKKDTNIEIECFVHGALCYGYSGQCLLSSFIGGRSGNRGQCAQPCRLLYKTKDMHHTQPLFNMKDLCTLEIIPDLVDAGISSFKIEGRMRKSSYTAFATAMYKKYVSLYLKYGRDNYMVCKDDIRALSDIYNRGGFTKGYYYQKNSPNMITKHRGHTGVAAVSMRGNNRGKALIPLNKGDVLDIPTAYQNYTLGSDFQIGDEIHFSLAKGEMLAENTILYRTRNEVLLQAITQQYLSKNIQGEVKGKLHVRVGEEIRLTLLHPVKTIEVTGAEALEAQTQPLTIDRIKKQLYKTGDSLFYFSILEIDMEGTVFLPMRALADIRRQGLSLLEDQIYKQCRRDEPSIVQNKEEKYVRTTPTTKYHVQISTQDQLEEALLFSEVDRIYIPFSLGLQWMEYKKEKKMNKEIFLTLPAILREKEISSLDKSYEAWSTYFDGFLVAQWDSLNYLREKDCKKPIIADHSLYSFNQYSLKALKNLGVNETTAPIELSKEEWKQRGVETSELLIYGRIPLMYSANCVQKNTKECRTIASNMALFDEKGKKFSLHFCCDFCYNILYSEKPISLYESIDEVYKLSPQALRMSFTLETREETKNILNLFLKREQEDEKRDVSLGYFKIGIR